MGTLLRVAIFLSGTIFTLKVIHLLINKKISEKSSLLWLTGSIVVFAFSINPMWLDKIAETFGISYPPSLLFLFSTLGLLFITLYHSVLITELSNQVRELTQNITVENFTIKTKEEEQFTYKEKEDAFIHLQ